jgi:hypothetical protein
MTNASYKYWNKFYKAHRRKKPSSFAKVVQPYLRKEVLELGCGTGDDLVFFNEQGLEVCGLDQVWGSPVENYLNVLPRYEYIYTRFFWHSIKRDLQLKILQQTPKWLFIEARTTDDRKLKKIYYGHKRNYVSVSQLVTDLKDHGFQIVSLVEGTGLSPYRGEDPHLVRVIAHK